MDSKIDIIVLGATGFTGKHAVKNLALLTRNAEFAKLKWGIAGRSKEKLNNLLSELEELDVEIPKVLTLECDILQEASLPLVTSRATVLVNATGPNALLSGPVVDACIKTGTHYVDISAELFHMLNIYRWYHKAAEQAGVLIVPACGFDCIPALGGLIYLERNFTGTLQSVECYNVLDIPKKAYFPGPNKCLLHYGTWESMIHEMHTFKQYSVLKKETFGEPDPAPEGLNRRFFHRHKGKFWCPYPGADRRGVVEMYQHYKKDHGESPYHFRSYITMPLFIHFFIIVPAFFIFYFMTYFSCLRNLLWKYPRFFTLGYVSHKGPNEEMKERLKFSFTLTGKGWVEKTDLKSQADKTVTVKVSGNDPGYRTTSMALILSAITILHERAKMPNGGVLTTATAFRGTNLIQKLQKHCMSFEVIEDIEQTNEKYVVKL